MNRQLGRGGGGTAWKRVRDIISQMYHGCTRWLSWHRGDSLLVEAHLRPSSVLRHHSNTPVEPPSSPCPVEMLDTFVLPVWIFFKKCTVLIHYRKCNLYGSPWTLICMSFVIFLLFFLKTPFSLQGHGEKKNCKYCGVLVTVQSVTLQLCRWSETPTSLMVNNSNNDVKDNYTNDASSSSWEI